ncbi:MAG: glycerol-3-phosphate transporter [Endozoicomonas sp.]
MQSFLSPAQHQERLADQAIDATYKRLRRQVFLGIFIGYAGYYLVRKNFSLAIPDLIEQGFSRTELGFALSGVSIAYGLSKFLMGNLSDRSDARKFITLGLSLSALTMIVMGTTPFATSSIMVMFTLLFINGWFQGMGWPSSGRVIVHWFSVSERGTRAATWNLAHNVGGGLVGPLSVLGMAVFADWHSVFFFPGLVALCLAAVSWAMVRDTPQSCGLPPIEKHTGDYPNAFEYSHSHEQEFSAREIFFNYVLNNRLLWYIAIANAFVYLIRYGVLDWAPAYLSEVKSYSMQESSWAYFAYEFAGIPGTLLCGYLSDRYFRGRRAPASLVYLVAVLIAVIIYWQNPPGNPLIDNLALIAIGFLIYGPVMLIGVHALDLVPKKAAGTAAGLTGLFGYMGGALFANIAIGLVVDLYGWNGGFIMLVAACLGAMAILILCWVEENSTLGTS